MSQSISKESQNPATDSVAASSSNIKGMTSCEESDIYLWFIFKSGKILLRKEGSTLVIPHQKEPPFPIPEDSTLHDIAVFRNIECKAFALKEEIEENESWKMIDLRSSFYILDPQMIALVGKSSEIINWSTKCKFCSTCRKELVQVKPITRQCPSCKARYHPMVFSCIIVRITKGDEIFLIHAKTFKGPHFSLVSGYLEAGESLEECLIREVKEETNFSVKNIQYFSSQPWPFPSQMMVGFTCEYDDGELKLQESEISEGRFFNINNLPELPPKFTIARQMIDDWIEKKRQ